MSARRKKRTRPTLGAVSPRRSPSVLLSPSSRLAAELEPFRILEKPNDVATIVADFGAINVLASWRRLSPTWRPPKTRQPAELDALWDWLWTGVHFDRELLAALAKTTEPEAHQLLRACAGARVAYPDGTISKAGETLLDAYVDARYPKGRGGRSKGQRDVKPRKSRKAADKKRKVKKT